MDSEQPQGGGTSAGGIAQGIQDVYKRQLFTGDKDSLVLSQTAKAIAEYPGNVWLPRCV